MITKPHYPDIMVQLTGEDGNAFMILGAVRKAMRRAGISQSEIEASFPQQQNVWLADARAAIAKATGTGEEPQ